MYWISRASLTPRNEELPLWCLSSRANPRAAKCNPGALKPVTMMLVQYQQNPESKLRQIVPSHPALSG